MLSETEARETLGFTHKQVIAYVDVHESYRDLIRQTGNENPVRQAELVRAKNFLVEKYP